MENVLYFSVFMFSTLVFIILYVLFNQKKIGMRKRMKIIENTGSVMDFNADEDKRKISLAGNASRLKGLYKIYVFERYFMDKKKKLSQAYILVKPEEFLLISIISGMLFGLMLMEFLDFYIVSVIGFIFGFKLPDMVVGIIKDKRKRKLNSQLPEALTILSNGLRAGLSFPQAIASAGKEMEAPLSYEFGKVVRDNLLGKAMDDCLLDLSERTDDEDLDMFITSLIIQRQVGGNLSHVLDTISDTIRERIKIKGEVRTLTAQSRLSAYVIGFLPVGIAMALFVMNPSYIGILFTRPLGRTLIAGALFMELMGVFIISRLVKLEV
jgi:tight adherence protein B